MTSDSLLTGETQLGLSDAVAAFILVENDGYLMQLRDDRPDIWYPNRWGLFGGAVEKGEDPLTALRRELYEELELTLGEAEFFARFDFHLSGLGFPQHYRNFYTVRITRAEQAKLILHEGAEMKVFPGQTLLTELRVSPYDDFAIMLHYSQKRLAITP